MQRSVDGLEHSRVEITLFEADRWRMTVAPGGSHRAAAARIQQAATDSDTGQSQEATPRCLPANADCSSQSETFAWKPSLSPLWVQNSSTSPWRTAVTPLRHLSAALGPDCWLSQVTSWLLFDFIFRRYTKLQTGQVGDKKRVISPKNYIINRN